MQAAHPSVLSRQFSVVSSESPVLSPQSSVPSPQSSVIRRTRRGGLSSRKRSVSRSRNPQSKISKRSGDPPVADRISALSHSRPSVCAEFGFVWRYTFRHPPPSSFVILNSSFVILVVRKHRLRAPRTTQPPRLQPMFTTWQALHDRLTL